MLCDQNETRDDAISLGPPWHRPVRLHILCVSRLFGRYNAVYGVQVILRKLYNNRRVDSCRAVTGCGHD